MVTSWKTLPQTDKVSLVLLSMGINYLQLRDEVTRDQTRIKSSRGRSSRHLYSKPFESKVIDLGMHFRVSI